MNKLITFLRFFLLPFSLIYYIIIVIRNYLYDRNLLKSVTFNTPIISIGNITTGGTGKTPLVIYLVEYFLSKNKTAGVISRGYKSETKELVVAYDGNNITSDVKSTGDELSMIVNRFKDTNNCFYAIAYFDRIVAIDTMINKFSPDIIILDDAFQNRKINKTVDIVILNIEEDSVLDSIMLPAGNLREPASSLKRADIELYNYKFSKISPEHKNGNYFKFNFTGLFNIEGRNPDAAGLKNVFVISGIANNRSFINTIKSENLILNKTFLFSDHHNYSLSDVKEFENAFLPDSVFITTEKDFIKLREFKEFIRNYPVYFLRIDVNLDIKCLEDAFKNKNIL